MAKSKAQSKKTPESNPMAEAMAAFTPKAAEVWQDIMQESARFMTERLQKDMETQKAMLACKSPVELLEVQTDFYQRTLSDYTAEVTRMLDLMSKAGGTSRSYDDVPL